MSDNDKRGGSEGPNTGVVVKARPKTRKPAMYKVLMLNDDYTPMEFVVHVLERFFQKSREEATRLIEDRALYDAMARVHNPYGDGQASPRISAAIDSFFEEKS